MTIRKWIFLCTLLSLALFLCACGAGLKTELSIQQDLSGCRRITCTIDNRELNNFVYGGINGLELLIRQNIPQSMQYQITADDTLTTVTFTIEFSSPADYRQKITNILKTQTDSTIILRQNIFINGIYIHEEFTSQDLLRWLADALTAAGMFDSNDKIKVNDTGSVLNITQADGKTLQVNTDAKINYDDITDNGADSIDIATTLKNDGSAVRTLRISFSNEKVSAIGLQKLQKYLRDAGAASIKTEDSNGSTVFAIQLKGMNIKEIAEQTSRLLGGDIMTTSYEYLENFGMNTAYNEALDMSSIVSVTQPRCQYSMTLPANPTASIHPASSKGISLVQNADGTMTIKGTAGVQPYISYVCSEKATFDRIEVITDLSKRNTYHRTVKFYVPAAQLPFNKNAYDKLLAGRQLEGKNISYVDNGNTDFRIYTWIYTAHSQEKFSEMTGELFKNSDPFNYTRELEGIRMNYSLYDAVNLKKLLSGMGKPKIHYICIPPKNAAVESIRNGKNSISLQLDDETGYYYGTVLSDTFEVTAKLTPDYKVVIVIILVISFFLIFILVLLVRRRKRKKEAVSADV